MVKIEVVVFKNGIAKKYVASEREVETFKRMKREVRRV